MDLSLQICSGPRYVTGEQDQTVTNLCSAIHACLDQWGDDPAYKEAAYKLRQVDRELDTLTASPGKRAAMRTLAPVSSGQEPHREAEYGGL